MDLISLALGLLKLVNLIMKSVDEEKFREDGRRQAFVAERKVFDERTGIGEEIRQQVQAEDIEKLRRELME